MTSLKTSIKTITYLSDIGCLEIQGASLLIHNRTTKKQEIIWQHTYTYDIYYKEDKRAQQINSFIIWSCKEITNNPHDKQAGTCKKTQIPCMHI